MFMLSLTYYQALPVFLDFLFPFGLQQYPHDPYFSGFRSEDRFSDAVSGVPIKELGRSGRDIRLCYSLKSVERITRKDAVEKWSIRQTSIYHSFDIITGKATWIVVKGDDLIKRRLEKATATHQYTTNMESGLVDRMFASAFTVHQVLCDWAGENWRWYLNDLEEQVQIETRHASSVVVNDVDLEPSIGPLLHSNTFGQDRNGNGPVLRPPPPPSVPPPSGPPPIGPPGQALKQPPQPKATDTFGLKHLQKVQFAQDQAGQALLILESNADVISEMRNYYQSTIRSEGWPNNLHDSCLGDVARFDKSAGTAERHLRLQCLRAKTLRSMLEDRKATVSDSNEIQ
jgi:hypothetical protein